MDNVLLEKAKFLAARNYTTSILEDKLADRTVVYMAKNPELDGCMAQGDTPEEAIENLSEARVDYIYDSLEDGVAIPEPASAAIQTTFTIASEETIITKTVNFEEVIRDSALPRCNVPIFDEAWTRT